MFELPIVVSGFLVGSILVGVTVWVLLGPRVYRALISSIPVSAALAGLAISKTVAFPTSPAWALSAGFWTATCTALVIFLLRRPDIALTLAEGNMKEEGEAARLARDFRVGLGIVTTLAAAGGFHLSNLLESSDDGRGLFAAPLAAVRTVLSNSADVVRSFGRPSSSGLLLAATLVAILIFYLRWRSKRGFAANQWTAALAAGLTGALVARVLAGEDFLPAFDSGPRLLGAGAAVLLLVLFLASVVRGDRPGFDSYTGGLGDGLGGWRITPSLAYLLGALALMAVFVIGTKDETQTCSKTKDSSTTGTSLDPANDSETDSEPDPGDEPTE